MSSFAELNIGMTGLFAAQQGLAVTSNNITNASTAGYSRQVLIQQASTPLSGGSVGMIGTGVITTGVERVRNSFLDQKIWTQSPTLGEYTVKTQQNSLIEGLFNEPSEDGFTSIITNMFNAFDSLSTNPTENANAYMVQQTMITFTDYFNYMSSSLTSYQQDLNFELKSVVDEINLLSERIQSLNEQIFTQELSGNTANYLRDQRDLCIDALSQLANIEVSEYNVTNSLGNTFQKLSITLDGNTLVDHDYVRTLAVEVRDEPLNEGDVPGLYNVVWSDGLSFDMYSNSLSGELKGIIDMRDGAGSSSDCTYNGIPYYRERLDSFVQTLAENLNEIYNRDANGDQLDPPQYLFSYTDEFGNIVTDNIDYSQMTALNFTISQQLLDDATNIRTNFEHDPINGENPSPANNDLLRELFAQMSNEDMFEQGNPVSYMISVFTQLAINTSESEMYYNTQTNVISTIETQRMSVSQVDTSEEFMNLIKYNQAYQAAAKIMSTMDGIYDITINRLGNW